MVQSKPASILDAEMILILPALRWGRKCRSKPPPGVRTVNIRGILAAIMGGIGLFTPARRDTLLVLIAVGLLLGPIWVPALNIGEPTYRYQRARVIVSNERGLAYANNTPIEVQTETLISADIGCSIPNELRICAFERYLASNHTILTRAITTGPNPAVESIAVERYEYVVLNDTAYRTTYIANLSIQTDQGAYRIELALSPVPLTDVLNFVSLNITTEKEKIPSVAAQAATTGVGTSHQRVDIPRTPIRISNGTYYRVYFASKIEPSSVGQFLGTILLVGVPIVGLLMIYRLSDRFVHRGTRTERRER